MTRADFSLQSKRFLDFILRAYAVCLGFIYAAGRGVVILFFMPIQYLMDEKSRPMIRAWYQRTRQLLWGSLIYNLVALFVIQPILMKLFPPLSFWERTQGFFGASTRWTYKELLPYLTPILWGLGNGLIFALLSEKTRSRERSQPEQTSQD